VPRLRHLFWGGSLVPLASRPSFATRTVAFESAPTGPGTQAGHWLSRPTRSDTPRETTSKAAFVQSPTISTRRKNEHLEGPRRAPVLNHRNPREINRRVYRTNGSVAECSGGGIRSDPAIVPGVLSEDTALRLRGPRAFSVLRSPSQPTRRCRMAR
jgi:hypothetical protein